MNAIVPTRGSMMNILRRAARDPKVGGLFAPLNYRCSVCSVRRCYSSRSDELVLPAQTAERGEEPSRGKAEFLLRDAALFDDHLSDKTWSTSPYPENIIVPRPEEVRSREFTYNPKGTSVLLFPGQGSQFVGMGKELLDYPSVREMFEIASDILGCDLEQICMEGPKEELNKCVNYQPALLVISLAAVQKLKVENPLAIDNCISTAGFSVGEYAALVFTGALSFEAAVRVVKIRAEAMQAAWQLARSGTATVFLLPDARLEYACTVAEKWCRRLGIEEPSCQVSSYLFPSCRTIAGNKEALQFIEMNAREFGIHHYEKNKVTGPFHCKLMKPAEPVLRKILDEVEIKRPMITVLANFDAKPHKDERDIRKKLVRQISSTVKWEQIMQATYKRRSGTAFPYTFACGPGKSLNKFLQYTNRPAHGFMSSVCAFPSSSKSDKNAAIESSS